MGAHRTRNGQVDGIGADGSIYVYQEATTADTPPGGSDGSIGWAGIISLLAPKDVNRGLSKESSPANRGYTRWLVAMAVIVLTSCGGPDSVDPGPNSTNGPSTTNTSGATNEEATSSTSTSLLSTTSLGVGLPRTASYSFIDVTITTAEIGNITPRTYSTETWEADADTHLFLTFEVRNTSNTDTANWPPTPFSLVIGGVVVRPDDVLEGRPHIGLTALNTTDMVLAFPVSAGQGWDDVSLVVAQDGRIPMYLPLVGPVPDYGYPVEVGVDVSGHITGGCGQDVEVTALGATAKIDLLDTPYPTSYGSRRAQSGERFLSVSLQAQNHGGQHCGGGSTNFGTNDVRLVVDGLSYAPIAGINQTILANSVLETDVHFVFPVNGVDLTLVIGDEDQLHLSVPVDVSEATALTVEG